jgi:hypothetical protein
LPEACGRCRSGRSGRGVTAGASAAARGQSSREKYARNFDRGRQVQLHAESLGVVIVMAKIVELTEMTWHSVTLETREPQDLFLVAATNEIPRVFSRTEPA